jgi:hypothetical protein
VRHEFGKSPKSVTGCKDEWSSKSIRPSFLMKCVRHAILSIRYASNSGPLSPDVIILRFVTCTVLHLMFITEPTGIIVTLNLIVSGEGVSFRNVCKLYTGEQFYIRVSMHRNAKLINSNKMQQYADICLLQNHSTCFGCPSHPSSGVQETVTAASGTGHSV